MLAISAIACETRIISRRRALGQDRQPQLELQVADDGEQVGVAGPLAVAVGRALDVRRAGLDRGEGVGHRAAGVVLAVDAEPDAGAPPSDRRATIVGDLRRAACRRWCRTAPPRRRRPRPRRAATRSAYVRVVAVAVEEVLAVQEDPPALGDAGSATVSRTIARFSSQRGAQRPLDVPDVGLGDQA